MCVCVCVCTRLNGTIFPVSLVLGFGKLLHKENYLSLLLSSYYAGGGQEGTTTSVSWEKWGEADYDFLGGCTKYNTKTCRSGTSKEEGGRAREIWEEGPRWRERGSLGGSQIGWRDRDERGGACVRKKRHKGVTMTRGQWPNCPILESYE